MKKIAIMTAGGDCAGLNSVIKSVVMSAANKGMKVIGILDGYIGFVEGKYIHLDKRSVYNIENQGGTILGSSNKECPFCSIFTKYFFNSFFSKNSRISSFCNIFSNQILFFCI